MMRIAGWEEMDHFERKVYLKIIRKIENGGIVEYVAHRIKPIRYILEGSWYEYHGSKLSAYYRPVLKDIAELAIPEGDKVRIYYIKIQ